MQHSTQRAGHRAQGTSRSWSPSKLPCCMCCNIAESSQWKSGKRLLAEALPLMKMKMKLRLPQADPDKMMTLTMAHIMRIISQRSAEPVPESGAYPASYTSPPLSLYHIQPPLCAARENVTQADSNVCLWSPGCPTSPHPPAPHPAC